MPRDFTSLLPPCILAARRRALSLIAALLSPSDPITAQCMADAAAALARWPLAGAAGGGKLKETP